MVLKEVIEKLTKWLFLNLKQLDENKVLKSKHKLVSAESLNKQLILIAILISVVTT